MINDVLKIEKTNDEQRLWAARLFADSDPWRQLGISYEKCLAMCQDPTHEIWIAQSGEANCGVVIMHPKGFAGSPYVKSIAVAEAFRSKGIGAALLAHVEAVYAPQNRFIFLCVSSFNDKAHAFYEKLGYQQVGILKDYLVDGQSEIILSKKL